MTTWFAEIAFFAAIIVVIVIHEAAHFGAAKRFKIKVDEFFVGFGPRLWSFRRGETEYGLKLFVLGGYVRIAGMNPFEEISPEDTPRTFGAKPIRQRAAVIAAGPATHFVIALVMFALWLGFIGAPRVSASSTYVSQVLTSIKPCQTCASVPMPSEAAGFRAGDHILSVNGRSTLTEEQFRSAIEAAHGSQVSVGVSRGSGQTAFDVKPVYVPQAKRYYVGVSMGPVQLPRKTAGFVGSITGAFAMLWDTIVQVLTSLGHVFNFGRLFSLVFGNAQRSVTDVTSVVGASQIAGQVAKHDPGDLLQIFALVNVFVGILNLLPILPFDGGHLALLAIEKVRGKSIDPRKLIPVSAVVAGLLITFMVMVVYLDIVKPVPFP